MKKYAYIGICLLLLAMLTACHANKNVGGGEIVEETSDSVTMPDSTETPDSVTVPDSTETPDSVTVPDSTEAPDSVTVPDSSEAPDSVTVPGSTETPDSVTVPDSTETPDSVTVPDSTEAPDSMTVPDIGDSQAEARNLTEQELRRWTRFLCQADCNGFLMSSYDTPLTADLMFVFYTGAGVGEAPSEEMLNAYLKANDFEEAYTDVTFIPYDAANKVLELRTGYTLEHFKLAGNDIPMYYSQTYKGYFQMAGDTNYMPVECVSGRENADGSLWLEVRESSDWSGESACSFETTLRPDSTGKTMLFDKNVVTGGWLTWEDE